MSGEWVLDRQPAGDARVLVYVRVGDAEAILQTIVEAGGEIIVPRTPQDAGIAYATFCDPAGNVLGDLPGRQLAATDRPKHELAGAPLKRAPTAALEIVVAFPPKRDSPVVA